MAQGPIQPKEGKSRPGPGPKVRFEIGPSLGPAQRRPGPNRPWAAKFWPKPIPRKFDFRAKEIDKSPTQLANVPCQLYELVVPSQNYVKLAYSRTNSSPNAYLDDLVSKRQPRPSCLSFTLCMNYLVAPRKSYVKLAFSRTNSSPNA